MKQLRSDLTANPPLAGAFTPKKGTTCVAQFSDGLWCVCLSILLSCHLSYELLPLLLPSLPWHPSPSPPFPPLFFLSLPRMVWVFTNTKLWPYPFLNKMPPPLISLFFAGCFFLGLGMYLLGKRIAYLWWGGECH